MLGLCVLLFARVNLSQFNKAVVLAKLFLVVTQLSMGSILRHLFGFKSQLQVILFVGNQFVLSLHLQLYVVVMEVLTHFASLLHEATDVGLAFLLGHSVTL